MCIRDSIDTGLGVSNIRKIVDSLTKLPVMTVTTHVHWDHIGGHKYFDNIAVHEAEKDLSLIHIQMCIRDRSTNSMNTALIGGITVIEFEDFREAKNTGNGQE